MANRRSGRAEREIVGVIPAAGRAARISPLPCSKEVYPLGFRPAPDGTGLRAKVAAHYLLEKMKFAGISKVYIVLRSGKWDIPAYFENGSALDLKLAYVITPSTPGPPYTVDEAYPFTKDAQVAFGFPDIVFPTEDVYVRLLTTQVRGAADLVLALFPARDPSHVDMVDVGPRGRVRQIVSKPAHSRLRYTWVAAVWTPVFSAFMHEHLSSRSPNHGKSNQELSVGEVFQAAIRAGITCEAAVFDDHRWIDIGRPEDLVRAVRWADRRVRRL